MKSPSNSKLALNYKEVVHAYEQEVAYWSDRYDVSTDDLALWIQYAWKHIHFPRPTREEYIQLMTEAYDNYAHEHKPGLSASNAGLPLIELFYRKFHPEDREIITPDSDVRIFNGNLFESQLKHIYLPAMGVEILEEQVETRYPYEYDGGLNIPGHFDFLLRWKGDIYLAEMKSCNGRNARIYSNVENRKTGEDKPMSNKYGYATQMFLYEDFARNYVRDKYRDQLAGELWIIYDREASQLYPRWYYKFDQMYDQKHSMWDYLDYVRSVYDVPQTWEECFQYAKIPEPMPRYKDKIMTGEFYPPDNMRFAWSLDKVYVTEHRRGERFGEERIDVLDYRYPDDFPEDKKRFMRVKK